MKDCKGNPSPDSDLEDIVEDFAYCRKYLCSVEEFKKHQEETIYICGMCVRCMTQDSQELECCAAMRHVGGPSLDTALKLHPESCSDC